MEALLEAALGWAWGGSVQGPGQRPLSWEVGCPLTFTLLSLLAECRREADAAGVPGRIQGGPVHRAGAVPLRRAGIVKGPELRLMEGDLGPGVGERGQTQPQDTWGWQIST